MSKNFYLTPYLLTSYTILYVSFLKRLHSRHYFFMCTGTADADNPSVGIVGTHGDSMG
jgi:hypothetical protein